MHYETAYRHNQALTADATAPVAIALHLLTAAIEDCRIAGVPLERDASVLLLMRALGESATHAAPDRDALRARCTADRNAIVASRALLSIAGHAVGDKPAAKRTFHAEARRALQRLVAMLDVAASDALIVTEAGADYEDGVTELSHAQVHVRVVPRGFLPDSEVTFFRCVDGSPAGRPVHRPVGDLLDPAQLAQRISTAINPPSFAIAA